MTEAAAASLVSDIQAHAAPLASLHLTSWQPRLQPSCSNKDLQRRPPVGSCQARTASTTNRCSLRAQCKPDHEEAHQHSHAVRSNVKSASDGGKWLHGLLSIVAHRPLMCGLLALPLIPFLVLRGIQRKRSVPSRSHLDPAVSLLWFRNDLRLHDHEALHAALGASDHVLPVYIFDPREYGKTPPGDSFARTGPQRAQFILESVTTLRSRLQQLGSDLLVRVGCPEEVLPSLMASCSAGRVYCHTEASLEEGQVEAAVQVAVNRVGGQLTACWGGTLFHLRDLPFDLQSMPANYTAFRERVAGCRARPCLPQPQQLKCLPEHSLDLGRLPPLTQLGFTADALRRLALHNQQLGAGLRGGETQALQHLAAFAAQEQGAPIRMYRQNYDSSSSSSHGSRTLTGPTSGGVLAQFTCRISPWLALGCLSPRHMVETMQQHHGGVAQASLHTSAGDSSGSGSSMADSKSSQAMGSAHWLELELLWRDFFRFITQKYTIAHLHSDSSAVVPDIAAPQRRQRRRKHSAAPAAQQRTIAQHLMPA